MPPNGDVNPYGVAVVTESTGRLVAGDVLVSNFNAKSNVQGTGTTIANASIVGPWDLTADSTATTARLFVTNALGGEHRHVTRRPGCGPVQRRAPRSGAVGATATAADEHDGRRQLVPVA